MTSPALATRLRNPRLVQRDADVVAEVAAVLERRQADLATWLASRRAELEQRARLADESEVRVQQRLATAERALAALGARLDERDRARAERVSALQAELQRLRNLADARGADIPRWRDSYGHGGEVPLGRGGNGGGSGSVLANASSPSERLGSALMYAGGLVLAWLVLWQVGLALGLG